MKRLLKINRKLKQSIVLSVDLISCFFVAWASLSVANDEIYSKLEYILLVAICSIVIAVPTFIKFGLYRAIFRFNDWNSAQSLIKATLVYGILFFPIFSWIGFERIPKSIGFIQPILLFFFIGMSRVVAKYFINKNCLDKHSVKPAAALVYGAGSAGRQLAFGLRQSNEIKPIGFIDDDSRMWGGVINGLPVYAPSDVSRLIQSDRGITDILLAIPSASRARQKEVLTALSDLQVRVRILPGLSQLANGLIKINDVREVEIEDVLGRELVQAKEALMHQILSDKVALVTGAGGSIGSELCRQILSQQPKTLVLFEVSEFALYAIERELRLMQTPVTIVPVLGSVLDINKLNRVLRRFGVQTVFHAAAYKHVPMIEMNPAAGVWNNVFGTLRTVESACQCGVETFVLVSTDKAVRPTNVMGCSKRMAELVLQAKSLQENQLGVHTTTLTMVRFGNVLGSSGSVVPVFREQIKNGGPVTVTHPEIIRYFMTIPEAAQLVIQAGAIGEGGDVMVLDMGEPVKIVDLAKRMIHLSGYSHKDESNPDGDIEIRFSGLRPGEKLYEELLIGDNTLPTPHSRIMRANEHMLSWDQLEPLLFELEAAVKAENSDAIRSLLKKAVPEFNPQSENGDILLG